MTLKEFLQAGNRIMINWKQAQLCNALINQDYAHMNAQRLSTPEDLVDIARYYNEYHAFNDFNKHDEWFDLYDVNDHTIAMNVTSDRAMEIIKSMPKK